MYGMKLKKIRLKMRKNIDNSVNKNMYEVETFTSQPCSFQRHGFDIGHV